MVQPATSVLAQFLERDRVAAATFEGHPAHGHVVGTVGDDQGFRDRHADLAGRQVRGRPEIELGLFAIQVPLARRVELGQQVLDEVAVADHQSVADRPTQPDGIRLAVHGLHRHDVPGPAIGRMDGDFGALDLVPGGLDDVLGGGEVILGLRDVV